MNTKLSPAFQKELPGLLGKVLEDLAQMLDLKLEVDVDQIELSSLDDVYETAGPGVVACRSVFARKVNGVGGLLCPESLADRLGRAAMMMDPPGEDDAFDYEGFVGEAMEEIFNIFVGSWNTTASPDFRLGSKIEERSVEHYMTSVPAPEAAGMFPVVLRFSCKLDDLESFFALLLPIKAVQGRGAASFVPATEFVRDTAPKVASAPKAVAPAEPAYDGPLKPVVFLDYTGSILPWIKQRTHDGKAKYLFSQGVEPKGNDTPPPAATILIGLDPRALKDLEGVSVVEIHEK